MLRGIILVSDSASEVRISDHRPVILDLLFLLVLLVNIGCNSKPLSEERISLIEREAGQQIGRAEAAAFIQSNVVLLAHDIQYDIQKLADEISKETNPEVKCRIHLVNSPIINALTFPDGDIFISSGLLDQIDNRDELAVVLGHEIAHLQNHDGLSQLRESVRLQRSGIVAAMTLGVLAAAGSSGVVAASVSDPVVRGPICDLAATAAAKVPEILVQHTIDTALGHYSIEQELRADKLGMILARQAGYDPAAAIDLIKKYEQQEKTSRR
jgi:predicted Zn-dependent protease